jgi:hypothetical protein
VLALAIAAFIACQAPPVATADAAPVQALGPSLRAGSTDGEALVVLQRETDVIEVREISNGAVYHHTLVRGCTLVGASSGTGLLGCPGADPSVDDYRLMDLRSGALTGVPGLERRDVPQAIGRYWIQASTCDGPCSGTGIVGINWHNGERAEGLLDLDSASARPRTGPTSRGWRLLHSARWGYTDRTLRDRRGNDLIAAHGSRRIVLSRCQNACLDVRATAGRFSWFEGTRLYGVSAGSSHVRSRPVEIDTQHRDPNQPDKVTVSRTGVLKSVAVLEDGTRSWINIFVPWPTS